MGMGSTGDKGLGITGPGSKRCENDLFRWEETTGVLVLEYETEGTEEDREVLYG